MSKVTSINEIIEKKNLLRKCQEKHANYVSIDAILMWLDNIKKNWRIDYDTKTDMEG